MAFVWVNEVGARDGLQNQPVLVPLDGKLELIGALVAAGLRAIEATSFVSPKLVPQMADAKDLFRALPQDGNVAYSALVLNDAGYDRAAEAGVPTVAVAVGATETMNRKNINRTLSEARTMFAGVMGRAAREGRRGQAYIAVALGCPFEGHVPPERVVDLATEMFDAGAADVVIADTIGAGSPSQVYDLFERLARRFDLARISAHFHDTRALALANAWAALKVGVRKFDSSIGGLGGCPFAPGAAGNVATEDLVEMLHQCGFETGIDTNGLRRAVKIAERLVGRPLGGRMSAWFNSRETGTASSVAS